MDEVGWSSGEVLMTCCLAQPTCMSGAGVSPPHVPSAKVTPKEANEHKWLRYHWLVEQFQRNGWRVRREPREAGCRGCAPCSLCKTFLESLEV